MTADALFERLGADEYLPTHLARGPWDPRSLHGGPPAALLARAVEAEGDGAVAGMNVARLTIELLRPVPVAPLRVSSTMLRPGRKVQLVGASLTTVDDGVEVARAVALRIRAAHIDAPLREEDGLDPPPRRVEAWSRAMGDWEGFHNYGVEMRYTEGRFESPGPVVVWMRLCQPVVEGEEPTAVQRVAACADFGNGVSNVLPFEGYLFINPDLSIHFARPPEGEWVCLVSRSLLSPEDGMGLAESELYDDRGRFGRSIQELLVDRR